MATDLCCTMILSLWVSLHFLLGSSGKELDFLPPPSNITFGMNGMFCLLLQWNPSENTANCSMRYVKIIQSLNRPVTLLKEKGAEPNIAVMIERLNLNEDIQVIVQAFCNNSNITSETLSKAIQLATGDPDTSVRNLNCIWYYPEFVQCTWQPGPNAPPNVNYTLTHWEMEETGCRKNILNTKRFLDLMATGSSCHNYTYNNGILSGCQFDFQKSFTQLSRMVIVVSDWTKEVKPYIYNVYANNIAKLKAPVIENAHRTSNNSIKINWNDMKVHKELLYQVVVEKSGGEIHDLYENIIGLNKEIPNALPDVTYTVKVRVRLPLHSINDEKYSWSDWSKEWLLEGETSGRNLSIMLLLFIPAIVVIAAVILLIYMRRLKILIFPRIPDPGKVLSNDLQHWLKNGRIAYNEPRKEEICPISMLDTPLTTPPME